MFARARVSYYRTTYLNSEHWKNLRIRRLARSKGKCDVCGAEGGIHLDVHHLAYHDLYDVKCKELRAVCRPCHDAVHAVMKAFPSFLAIKNASKRWGRIARVAKKWRRYSERYGEDCAKAAIVLRFPYQREEHKRSVRNHLVKITSRFGYGQNWNELKWMNAVAHFESL